MAITKDNVIGETFFQNGMMCIGCPASQGESIEQASQVHGLDADALVNALNDALKAE